MRLVHISDLHFGALQEGIEDHLRAAILKAAPDLVAVSGDLTMRGRSDEFRQARAFLDSIPLPRLVVPGNHDVEGSWRFWERFLTPLKNYTTIAEPDLEPVWIRPGVIVVGMNSARSAGMHLDWSRGRLSREQMARLKTLYADAHPETLRVLVVHHPPAAPPHGTARHLIGRLGEFMEAVRDAGVDLVLSGHFHMSYAATLTLPSGAAPGFAVLSSVSTATSHRLKGEPNGFHILDLESRRMVITDHAWTGAAYEPRRAWTFLSDSGARDWRLAG